MAEDILPDSRALAATGSVRGPTGTGNWIPVYCHNCGKANGLVPEENCTFAFFLCDPCAAKWGNQAHFYLEPDRVFWDRVRSEQIDRYARVLSPVELVRAIEDPADPISKLFKDRLAKGPL